MMRVRASLVAAALLGLMAGSARANAQDTNAVVVRADSDTVIVRTLPVNGLLMQPQTLRYRMTAVFPDSSHLIGTRDLDLRRSTYGAFPAWLAVDTRSGGVFTVDTLFMSLTELRPLHWSSTIGWARMALEFTPDSLYGATTGPTGQQNIVMAHGRDLLVGAAMAELVQQLMPHTVGRVDSVTVLQVDLGSARILPAALSVDGEQDITTPLGPVHCWVVTLASADLPTVRYWIAETNPVVVRTRQAMPGMPGVEFEQQLVSRR